MSTTRSTAADTTDTALPDAVAAVFGEVGADGSVHAVDLASGAEVGYRPDEPVVLASVFKVPVLVELFRRFDDGRLDPRERVDVPLDGRSDGPTGLSVMTGPVEMSVRDLAYWMMSVSDNAATDILVEMLGPDAINATARELGLTATRVDGTCADLFATFREDVGDDVLDPDSAPALRTCRAVDPLRSLHAGTARDITRLFAAIWDDRAASPEACAEMRRILGAQAWPHRLRTGFPETDTLVSAKTGTLPFWRNEAGVVEDGEGGRYAVAVFVHQHEHSYRHPAADGAIGRIGRLAVDALRPPERRRPLTPVPLPRTGTADVARRIEERARELGATVRLYAVDVDGDGTVDVGGDTPVVTASVGKVPMAVELARQGATGEADLDEQLTVTAEQHVDSLVGLAYHQDPVRLTYQDVGRLMLTVSDNLATDLVLAKVGRERVNALLADLGLPGTGIPVTCKDVLDSVSEDLGLDYADDDVAVAGTPVAELRRLRALTPELTWRTTPKEMVRLLAMVWRDEAAPPEACATVRTWLGQQIWSHRLTSGFPDDGITVSGKTGTLPLIRNEVGVVEYPDGGRYAVGVFTLADDAAPKAPRLDHLIGWAAAQAVAHLRGEDPPPPSAPVQPAA